MNPVYYLYDREEPWNVFVELETNWCDLLFVKDKKIFFQFRLRDYIIVHNENTFQKVDIDDIDIQTWEIAQGNLTYLPLCFQCPPYSTKIQNAFRRYYKIAPIQKQIDPNPLLHWLFSRKTKESTKRPPDVA